MVPGSFGGETQGSGQMTENRGSRKLRSRGRNASFGEVAEGDIRSFTARWRGRFKAARRKDSRYEALARKYL